MADKVLTKLIEHNNWANLEMVRACSELDGEQLDAVVGPVAKRSMREELLHLVDAQEDYLAFLTLPPGARARTPPTFAELEESVRSSGARLLRLAQGEDPALLQESIHDEGYRFEPWVLMVQAINHATEHRRQIAGLMRAIGASPPQLDGWAYGETRGAVVGPTE